MMKLSQEHLPAVWNSPLRTVQASTAEPPLPEHESFGALKPAQIDGLHDSAYEYHVNEAPVVGEYQLEQDFGPYLKFIRGVEGAFFISVLEHDDLGPFLTLPEARRAFERAYGTLVSR